VILRKFLKIVVLHVDWRKILVCKTVLEKAFVVALPIFFKVLVLKHFKNCPSER
jgi:hypothetical protein